MPDKPTTSFQLPQSKTVDVFLIQLPNGKTVARTREELEHAPPPVAAPRIPTGA
jgi:hypothetical protein